MEVTREEHLKWCKDRALAYLPADPPQAFASMLSDLRKHDETSSHAAIQLGVGLMTIPGWIDNDAEVRSFIVGFN